MDFPFAVLEFDGEIASAVDIGRQAASSLMETQVSFMVVRRLLIQMDWHQVFVNVETRRKQTGRRDSIRSRHSIRIDV